MYRLKKRGKREKKEGKGKKKSKYETPLVRLRPGVDPHPLTPVTHSLEKGNRNKH